MEIMFQNESIKDLPLVSHVFDYLKKHKAETQQYFVAKNIKQINRIINEVVIYSTNKYIEKMYIKNDEELNKKVFRVYKSLVTKLFNKLFQNESVNFVWVKKLLIEHENKLNNIVIEPIYLSEYSPNLQLEILNINLKEITEPILDFGCGEKAKLVYYLRNLGLDAYGIDSRVNKSRYTFQSDWFKYHLKANYWGTVISHLAFTSNFKRIHYQKNYDYVKYAEKYMNILDALKVGGVFCYTPDLSFIEPLLPVDKYKIKKYSIDKLYDFFKNYDYMNIQTTHIMKL